MDKKRNEKVEMERDVGSFPVVKENDTCPHWQPDGDTSLTPSANVGTASSRIFGKRRMSIAPIVFAAALKTARYGRNVIYL